MVRSNSLVMDLHTDTADSLRDTSIAEQFLELDCHFPRIDSCSLVVDCSLRGNPQKSRGHNAVAPPRRSARCKPMVVKRWQSGKQLRRAQTRWTSVENIRAVILVQIQWREFAPGADGEISVPDTESTPTKIEAGISLKSPSDVLRGPQSVEIA